MDRARIDDHPRSLPSFSTRATFSSPSGLFGGQESNFSSFFPIFEGIFKVLNPFCSFQQVPSLPFFPHLHNFKLILFLFFLLSPFRMYSFLVASRQLYSDFLVDLFAKLLSPNEANGAEKVVAQQQQQQHFLLLKPSSTEPIGGLFLSLLNSILGMALWWLLLGTLLLLLLLALLHRPLPAGIADRKKIALFEFLMRLTNEYLGALVELCAGPFLRNKLTRGLSYLSFPALPRWLHQWAYRSHWCEVRNERIAGVRCRLYLPKGGGARQSNGAIVYIHGGGWCIGRPRFYDGALLYLARKLGVSAVSIDYSLSPEVKFPTALFECEKVIDELHRNNFSAYGVDPQRVALMGDSAGANLCAVLCQRALKAGRPWMFKCQLLIYPVVHMLNFRSPSHQYFYQTYPDTSLLNPKLLARWYLMYMGIEPSAKNIRAMTENRHLSKHILENSEVMALVHDDNLPKGLSGQKEGKKEEEAKATNWCWKGTKNKVGDVARPDTELSERMAPLLLNPDICPLLGTDLDGLCPALICTAGVDILRDEGILYAQRLRQFGVSVEWKHYEAAYHGILNMCRSRQRRRILNDISDYLQRHLFPSTA